MGEPRLRTAGTLLLRRCEQEALHTGATSSDAQAFIEDLCASGEPLPSTLRLLCLLSLVSNGFKPKT